MEGAVLVSYIGPGQIDLHIWATAILFAAGVVVQQAKTVTSVCRMPPMTTWAPARVMLAGQGRLEI